MENQDFKTVVLWASARLNLPLPGAVFITTLLLSSSADGLENCTRYTNGTGSAVPAKLCDSYCCGNNLFKYCCSDCSKSISQNATCSTEEWDPTSTIVQGVFIAVWFVIILTVWGLQSNGCLDTGKCPKKRRRFQGPRKQLFEGDYPRQPPTPITLVQEGAPTVQDYHMSEDENIRASRPFSPTHSEAGSEDAIIPAADVSTSYPASISDSIAPVGEDDPPILPISCDDDALHSVEVHPDPTRRDYGSTEQIIPLSRREPSVNDNQAFVNSPDRPPPRLPPIDRTRIQTPSSVILNVRPSVETSRSDDQIT